jgi:hypothetical protein
MKIEEILEDTRSMVLGNPMDNPNFRQWFGLSKIVDRKGNPMPVYHGSVSSFSSFDGEKSNSKSKTGVPKNAFLFSTSPDNAASYAGQFTWMTGHKDYREGGNVVPVYLKIVKPLTINARGDDWNNIRFKDDDWDINHIIAYAQRKGYDGLVVKNVIDTGEGMSVKATTIVAFGPQQIKSVFNTQFSDSVHLSEKVDDDELDEMAQPTETMRQQRYYHGVGSTTAAESIIQEGLKGQETQRKSLAAPIKGRVYMSASLRYAIIYALGGNYDHAMLESEQKMADGMIDPFGYVFVIEGKDLVDVQPDEDSVGEFLSHNSKPVQEPWLSRTGQPLTQADGQPIMRTLRYRCAITDDKVGASIWYYIEDHLTDNQKKRILDGEVSYMAAGGKRVLKAMPDWMKVELINRGAHVAHGGAIRPSECWKIQKNRLNELKKDGSNFFTVAERIK